MGSKLAKTFRTDLLSHLVHHSSFSAWKKMKFVSLRMGSKLAKTLRTALLSHFADHSSFCAWKKWKNVFLRMGSKLAKTFRTALLSHLVHHSTFWAWKKMKNCFAPNGPKTCQNVQNGSLKPFGAAQLIVSLKKNKSLRMGSKLAKTLRTALLSHFADHSSFWSWKKGKIF